ncbi:hypothetical protein QFZ24_000166 [Streptomyces phaeochromogenes]|nr:hypothetical protein [Streptomyces phaeochromogenes]
MRKGLFQGGQVATVRGAEVFLGGDQPAAPIQGAGLAAQFLPGVRGLAQFAVRAQPFAVVLDPAVQPGPAGDEGFVGEFDHVAVEGEQPRPDKCLQHGGGVRPAGGVQLRALGRAAGIRGAVTGGDQTQQHPAGGHRLVLGEPAVDLFSGLGDRAVQASGRLITGQGQCLAPAAPPGLQQHVGQQRQPARRVGHFLDQPGGQGPFHGQPGSLGRLDDSVAQFRRAHPTGQHIGVSQRVGQVAVFGAAAVEVAAHCE